MCFWVFVLCHIFPLVLIIVLALRQQKINIFIQCICHFDEGDRLYLTQKYRYWTANVNKIIFILSKVIIYFRVNEKWFIPGVRISAF
jgi:hypothetical protein